jgi:uncharacterized protein (TIGR02246 family)
MKIRLVVALVGLAIGFAAPAFAQQTVDPKIEQQIRVLASKYDAAINQHDAPAVAALYAQDAVWATYHDGTYHGPQAIEKEYERLYFKRWNKSNYITTVDRLSAVGNEIRSFGTWSCNYQGNGSVGSDSGHYRTKNQEFCTKTIRLVRSYRSFPPVATKCGLNRVLRDDAWMRTGMPKGTAQIAGGTFRMGSDAHYSGERRAHSGIARLACATAQFVS